MLAVAVVAALWAGQEIFVPIALAVLLSFVLAPAVRRLQGLRIPRAAAVPVVVLLAFALIVTIGTVVALQVRELCRKPAALSAHHPREGDDGTGHRGRQRRARPGGRHA